MERVVEIKISGEGVSPATVDARTLFHLAVTYLDAVAEYAEEGFFTVHPRGIFEGSAVNRMAVCSETQEGVGVFEGASRTALELLEAGYQGSPKINALRAAARLAKTGPGGRANEVSVAVADEEYRLNVAKQGSPATFNAGNEDLRGRVLGAKDGKTPRVWLIVEGKTLMLTTTKPLMDAAGKNIGAAVAASVVARRVDDVTRNFPFVSGALESMDLLGAQRHPLAVIDAWSANAGRPFAGITIEQALTGLRGKAG